MKTGVAPPPVKDVGIWIRVSTEDQAKGESPEHHLERANRCSHRRRPSRRSMLVHFLTPRWQPHGNDRLRAGCVRTDAHAIRGGILDRLDSLFFATPVFFWFFST